LINRLQKQFVRADFDRAADPNFFLNFLTKRLSGKPNKNQYYAEVNNVAAVTTRVSQRQFHRRRKPVQVAASLDDPSPAVILLRNRSGYKGAQGKANEGEDLPRAQRERDSATNESGYRRSKQIPLQAFPRCLPPSQ